MRVRPTNGVSEPPPSRARIVVDVLPVSWLAFEIVVVAWPRRRPAPLDAPGSTPPVVHRFVARPTDGR